MLVTYPGSTQGTRFVLFLCGGHIQAVVRVPDLSFFDVGDISRQQSGYQACLVLMLGTYPGSGQGARFVLF